MMNSNEFDADDKEEGELSDDIPLSELPVADMILSNKEIEDKPTVSEQTPKNQYVYHRDDSNSKSKSDYEDKNIKGSETKSKSQHSIYKYEESKSYSSRNNHAKSSSTRHKSYRHSHHRRSKDSYSSSSSDDDQSSYEKYKQRMLEELKSGDKTLLEEISKVIKPKSESKENENELLDTITVENKESSIEIEKSDQNDEVNSITFDSKHPSVETKPTAIPDGFRFEEDEDNIHGNPAIIEPMDMQIADSNESTQNSLSINATNNSNEETMNSNNTSNLIAVHLSQPIKLMSKQNIAVTSPLSLFQKDKSSQKTSLSKSRSSSRSHSRDSRSLSRDNSYLNRDSHHRHHSHHDAHSSTRRYRNDPRDDSHRHYRRKYRSRSRDNYSYRHKERSNSRDSSRSHSRSLKEKEVYNFEEKEKDKKEETPVSKETEVIPEPPDIHKQAREAVLLARERARQIKIRRGILIETIINPVTNTSSEPTTETQLNTIDTVHSEVATTSTNTSLPQTTTITTINENTNNSSNDIISSDKQTTETQTISDISKQVKNDIIGDSHVYSVTNLNAPITIIQPKIDSEPSSPVMGLKESSNIIGESTIDDNSIPGEESETISVPLPPTMIQQNTIPPANTYTYPQNWYPYMNYSTMMPTTTTATLPSIPAVMAPQGSLDAIKQSAAKVSKEAAEALGLSSSSASTAAPIGYPATPSAYYGAYNYPSSYPYYYGMPPSMPPGN
ncbi:hypothetical protein WA158_002216 [Blastocystis sp. Blastoise]